MQKHTHTHISGYLGEFIKLADEAQERERENAN